MKKDPITAAFASELNDQAVKPAKAKNATINKEELVKFLKENLRIHVVRDNFTNPNDRIVKLTLDGEIISSTSFSVVQTREYEG